MNTSLTPKAVMANLRSEMGPQRGRVSEAAVRDRVATKTMQWCPLVYSIDK